jgi:threonine/homoserine/homoserine lactone efflux protein
MVAAALLGMGIGLLVAAQVGPVWLLCARSAARFGFTAGAMIGVGAASVDLLYAGLAALGVGAFLSDPFARAAFGLLGAVVLGYYALRTLRSAWLIRNGLELPTDVVDARAALRTGVIATASNPLTILSWAAVFGGASVLGSVQGPAEAAALLAGIALGSLALHLGLSVAFAALGGKASRGALSTIDVVSGIGLAGFAGALAYGSISHLRSQ